MKPGFGNNTSLRESHFFEVPIDGTINNQKGEFQRIEDKYLIPRHLKALILDHLNQHMHPSYLDDHTEYTLIESLYFDSPQFDFLMHHFLNMEKRYKLRVRRYAPNGHWSSTPSLLELKSKINGESKKRRFMIPDRELTKLKEGKFLSLTPEIQEINSQMKYETLEKRIQKINDLILQYQLRPVLSIKYKRLAFEADGVRITLDEGVNGEDYLSPVAHILRETLQQKGVWEKASELMSKYNSENHIIMEIKHQGTIPVWIQNLLNDNFLMETNFSKYCWFNLCKMQSGK